MCDPLPSMPPNNSAQGNDYDTQVVQFTPEEQNLPESRQVRPPSAQQRLLRGVTGIGMCSLGVVLFKVSYSVHSFLTTTFFDGMCAHGNSISPVSHSQFFCTTDEAGNFSTSVNSLIAAGTLIGSGGLQVGLAYHLIRKGGDMVIDAFENQYHPTND